MALASKSSPSSDVVGLAILTALNISDEYFRTRSALSNSSGTLSARAEALEKIVDQAFALAEYDLPSLHVFRSLSFIILVIRYIFPSKLDQTRPRT